MANVLFKRGQSSALQSLIDNSKVVDGAFYLTEDTNHLYIGKGDNALAKINGNLHAVNSLPATGEQGEFYYLPSQNILAYYDNGKWVQLNPDTNTTYKAEALQDSTEGTVIRLSGKEINAASFNKVSDIKFIGAGTATVTAEDGAIKISVPATDLSDYYTKQEVDDKLNFKVDKTYIGEFTASEGVDTVVKYIDARTSNIASDDRVKAIEDKINHTETGLDTKASIAALNEVDGKFANYDTATVAAEKVATAVSTLENGQVKLNKEAIDLLKANSDTVGSVDQKIKTAIADFTSAYITGNEDEVINRLQEIVDWINTDEDGVTKILADIAKNKEDIAGLGSTKADAATTLEGYGITNAYTKTEVDNLVDGLEQAIEDLPDVTVVEGTGIDVAVSGDAYTVSLEAITKNDTTGDAKVQEAKGTVSFDAVTGVTYDEYGRVTGIEKTSITVTDTDTHNALNSVEVAVEAAEGKNSAEITHTVTMADSESDEAAFTLTSGYTVNNGGIEITANGTNVNIDLVWGSF